ncbi:MAG: hypothetical protein QNJ72_31340 [Pleurocapsa sp. MO_226.B13]|nr:hypothetical protein [Pleurocapsa sp. MO_226.B13]
MSIEFRRKADKITFDDTNADLVEGVSEAALQTVIEKLDERLDTGEQRDRYFVEPIVGVFDTTPTGLNSGDRYILNSQPNAIQVFNGSSEEFIENAIVSSEDGSIYNTFGDWITRFLGRLTLNRAPTTEDDYPEGTEWSYNSEVWKVVKNKTSQSLVGISSTTTISNPQINDFISTRYQSFTFSTKVIVDQISVMVVGETSFSDLVEMRLEVVNSDNGVGNIIATSLRTASIRSSRESFVDFAFEPLLLEENKTYSWRISKVDKDFRLVQKTDRIRNENSGIVRADGTSSSSTADLAFRIQGINKEIEWINLNTIIKNAVEIAELAQRYETYSSPELNYINGAEVVFPHDWDDFDPTTDWYQIQAWAVCTSNQNGWVIGERALLSRRATVSVDGDNIYLQIGNNGISITRKEGNLNEFNLNPNNWLVYVRATRRKS